MILIILINFSKKFKLSGHTFKMLRHALRELLVYDIIFYHIFVTLVVFLVSIQSIKYFYAHRLYLSFLYITGHTSFHHESIHDIHVYIFKSTFSFSILHRLRTVYTSTRLFINSLKKKLLKSDRGSSQHF